MARSLDTTNASPTRRQPFGVDANLWMQTAYNEQDAAAVIAWIGGHYSAATVYLLYGGVLSSSAGTTTVTAGMIFTNGVFTRLLAASYADPVGPAINIVNYQVTYGDGVGTTFSDGFVANVQINRQAICAAGTSGSGTLCNYVDLVPLSNAWEDGGALTGTYTFNRNITYRRATTTGTDTITTSSSSGRVGSEVIILANCAAGDTVAFAGLGTANITGAASLTAPVGAVGWVIRMKLATIGTGTKVIAEVYTV